MLSGALPSVSSTYIPTGTPRTAVRASGLKTAVVATADGALRCAIAAELRASRWQVREAPDAAEMFALLEIYAPSICFMDSLFPDLDARECVRDLHASYPEIDILVLDGTDLGARAARSPLRTEALHAVRQAQDGLDAPAWKGSLPAGEMIRRHEAASAVARFAVPEQAELKQTARAPAIVSPSHSGPEAPLEEFVGADPRLLEVSRRIQLVARRKTAVLVHGATGTGKELVARALHRLSGRVADRFVAINCAAIPEALVESELFGHARGAFTGAHGNRVGRIEAAAGGTLFLDEIGELPLLVQSKLLRFLESGVIQRVGENEEVRVDVRVVAATHRKLGAMARDGSFRLDLLHRLSVFLIQTPPLDGRTADIDALLAHALQQLAQGGAGKRFSAEAREKLHGHSWPGNVRELQNTVERAWILAGTDAVIGAECVDFGEELS